MLDQDFCSFLEYKICSVFEDANNLNTKSFWCDGILLSEPEKNYSQKFVKDNRQVKLKAFIGQKGGELALKETSRSKPMLKNRIRLIYNRHSISLNI